MHEWIGTLVGGNTVIGKVYALEANEFRLASFLRLGHPLPFRQYVSRCDCGEVLDEKGYHLLTCKHGGCRVWQRNFIVSGWADCLNELRIQHDTEPRHRYAENENRPEIAVYDSTRGTSYDLDVSMAHPWSQDAICKAALEQGWAAELRQMRNMRNNVNRREVRKGCSFSV